MTAPLTPRERVRANIESKEVNHTQIWPKVVDADVAYKLAAELEEANKIADALRLAYDETCVKHSLRGREIDKLTERAEAAERQLARYREKYGELE